MTATAPRAEGSKKRKRTGSEREARRKALVQAEEENASGDHQFGTETDAAPRPDEADEGHAGPSAATLDKTVDSALIEKRLPQALKTLHPVFKQAKTFEVQRLVKKIKFLRSKGDAAEIADLENQLKVLSVLKLQHILVQPIVQSHLLLKLRKHPQLKHTSLSPCIVDRLTSAPTVAGSSSSTNELQQKVENRLCSAKNVAPVVKNVVAWLMGENGAKLVRSTPAAKETSKLVARAMTAPLRNIEVDDSLGVDDEMIQPLVRDIAEGPASDGEDEGLDIEGDGWESGSVSGGDYPKISLQNEADSGADNSDDNSPPARTATLPKPRTAPGKATKASDQKPAKATKPPSQITSSVFLPSLASGFTRGDDGDSDPDMDFDEDGVIGRKGATMRKNRRGQRARQAIWEKKYGRGAKHVVKAREEEVAKTKSKSRSGANAETVGAAREWGRRDPAAHAIALKSTIEDRAGATPASVIAPGARVHPSWEAARLRRQKEGALPASAGQATKIVFD